jgi:hypothetical protein
VSCNGTEDGTTIYFDGLQLNTDIDSQNGDSGLFGDQIDVQVVSFGARVTQAGTDAEFDGYVDDYAIYDRTTDWGQNFDICKAREFFNNRANVGREAVAYYPLNGNADDKSAPHQLGRGNDGTLINSPTPAKDRFGCENQAIKFDKEQWISANYLTTSLDGVQDLTISAWVKTDQTDVTILSFDDSNHDNKLRLYIDNSGQICLDADAATNPLVCSSTYITDNKWYHIAMTLNSTDTYLYVNATQGNNTTGWNNPITYTDTFSIATDMKSHKYFTGKIDDVVIFNRVLNATEIKNLYYGRRIDFEYIPSNIDSSTPPWNKDDD